MKKIVIPVLFIMCTMLMPVMAATTHTMRDGDTLWDLAARYYGDPTLYPILLQVNDIDNPRTISNGFVVIIPDKNDMKEIANESDPGKKKALLAKAGAKKAGGVAEKPKTPGTSPDAISRSDKVNPDGTSFLDILNGPKVSGDKLIKINVP